MLRDLKIFQANVAKTGSYHDVALNLAWEKAFDIVLVQEPYAEFKEEKKKITKSHPGFLLFSPIGDWTESLPDVLTYVRIDPSLLAIQTQLASPRRGMCWVEVNGVTIANIYRRAGDQAATTRLLDQGPLPSKYLIAGDFNAIHWSWQPNHEGTSPGSWVADWVEENDLMTLLTDETTHRLGNTIDLVFSNLFAEAQVNHSLATGSDHHTIEISIPKAI